MATPTSPLTRSVGSMTSAFQTLLFAETFQLTRSVGNVTSMDVLTITQRNISTHTLRGERDKMSDKLIEGEVLFQLTRSVGSVTRTWQRFYRNNEISTHTLRGERDLHVYGTPHFVYISTHTLRGERDITSTSQPVNASYFNSHAPWGAWRLQMDINHKQ